MPEVTQLAFDLEALGLKLEPTPSMLNGSQRVAQHSWCGTVIVWPRTMIERPRWCPVCEQPDASWWEQEIGPSGLAGLRQLEPEPHDSGRAEK